MPSLLLSSRAVECLPQSQGQMVAPGCLASSQALGFHACEVWRMKGPRWVCLSSYRFAEPATAEGGARGMKEEKETEGQQEEPEEDPAMAPHQHSLGCSPRFPSLSRQVRRQDVVPRTESSLLLIPPSPPA